MSQNGWKSLSPSDRITAAIIIILLPIFLLFLLPGTIFSSNGQTKMIDLSSVNVLNLSQDQMDQLKSFKFVENATGSPSEITRAQLPKNHRVIPPGSFVTMDYQEDRLNVYIDSEGKITKVKRG